MENTVKIYMANLAEYNNGNLVGKWLELPMNEDDLKMEISELGEYAIHDYEADFQISEYTNIWKLNEMLEMLENGNHDMEKLQLVDKFLDMEIDDLEAELENIYSHYLSYNSRYYPTDEELMVDFAETYTLELYGNTMKDLPLFVSSNIDYGRIWHELQYDFDYIISKNNQCIYYKYY